MLLQHPVGDSLSDAGDARHASRVCRTGKTTHGDAPRVRSVVSAGSAETAGLLLLLGAQP